MASKVNIVLDDDVKHELDSLVEAGMRSRVINAALRKELAIIRRKRLSAPPIKPSRD
jgi:Arc/MetJ-type ribon-helix-helix transcriptional regulator